MNFRLGQSTIFNIIKDICRALRIILESLYLKIPNSEEEWKVWLTILKIDGIFHIALTP